MTAENAGNNAKWCGQSIERVEDAALLTGRGRYIDDIGVRADTLHAAILRSPHAHAVVKKIDVSAALQASGVVAVLTGAEVVKLSAPLAMGIRAPIQCWPIAVERVRYVGEPVAVVVAPDRYLAEDALELIEVDYEPLQAVVDPVAALTSSVLLHDGLEIEHRERAGVPLRRSGERPSPMRRTASPSRSNIRATPARRSRPMAWWRNTTPARTATMCLPTSWGRSRCTR